MRALLDVNVWIALFDDAHQSSELANSFIAARGVQIATCPLVENGVIRVMSSPRYSRRGVPPMQQVREKLREAYSLLDHAIWPDDISLRDDDLFDFRRVQGHNQVTDLHLFGLAVKHGGCLITSDQAIALSSVRGAARQHLKLL